MAGKLISDLNSGTLSLADAMEIDKDVSGTRTSFKTTVKDIVDFANHNVADEYDSTSTYAIGDYVMYESTLYKCITAVSSAENFDSTKWTAVVVTDEMGSGGGGGTGGHTIIDENGNSMTARAGLQFVGGANVSDDATNNKTIVDLASAGGIDGVFIDVTNVIHTISDGNDSFKEWIATDDCYIIGTISSSSKPAVQIDGVTVAYSASTTEIIGVCVLAKKGQSVKYRMSAQSTLTVYGIQTGTTHSKFQPVIYSFEEREIGVWTDGKPLYEKTIEFGALPNATTKDVAHNISNVDNIWIHDGFCHSTSGTVTLPVYYSMDKNSTPFNPNGFSMTVNNTNVRALTYTDRSAFTECYITLRYTKTTDVAGSGSWTPQGVPAVHYSENEQVIGTWISRSGNEVTLYEKTYRLGRNSDNINANILSDLNIAELVDGKWYTWASSVYSILSIDYNISTKLITNKPSTKWTTHIVVQYTKTV